MVPKNKKILFLIDSLKAIGGAEQMFIDQANYFATKSIEVHAGSVLAGRSNYFNRNLSSAVHFTEFSFQSAFDIREYFRLVKYLKKNDIKIIYSFLDFSNTVSRICKLFYPAAKIAIIEPGNPFRRGKLPRFFEWFFDFLVYQIFAISIDVQKRLISYLAVHRKKIIAVRNGVPEILAKNEVEEKFTSSGNEKFTIFHIGNMKTENKGHHGMIQAIGKIRRDRPKIPIQFLLAGDGSMREELEALAKAEGIGAVAKFLGAVPHDELKKYFKEADVFIFNSSTEGGAMSIMEAASAGLPTVTSNFNSVDEVVINNETGFIVERDDISEFAVKIEKFYDNPTLRIKMGRRAREVYEQEFTFEIWADFFIKELFG